MIDVWNGFIFVPIGGFLLVFLGALFLFAEVLVKGRFIFGAFGFILISLYFLAHIQEGTAMWMGLTFIIGIVMVIVDGKFIGDGTIGAIGLIIMLVSLALPAPTILYGAAVATAFIIGALGSFLFPKFFPRRELWSKLALKDTLSSEKGYNSMNESYKALLHKEGIAETDFRPSGSIKIDHHVYSAVSKGKWIKKGSKLIVTEVSGTRILVTKKDEEE